MWENLTRTLIEMLKKHFFNLYTNGVAAFNQIKLFCLVKPTMKLANTFCGSILRWSK